MWSATEIRRVPHLKALWMDGSEFTPVDCVYLSAIFSGPWVSRAPPPLPWRIKHLLISAASVRFKMTVWCPCWTGSSVSTSKDILIWVKEQKQLPPPRDFLWCQWGWWWSVCGTPSHGSGLHCLDAKNRWDYHLSGSLRSGSRDNFFEKKAVLFPNGEVERKQTQPYSPSGQGEEELWSWG